MSDLVDALQAFDRWLERSLHDLAPLSSINAHIDELASANVGREEQLPLAVELFARIIKLDDDRLRNRLVMLAIPLESSTALDRVPPRWLSLSRELSHTPASIYVMSSAAYLQPDLSERYIAPYQIPEITDRATAGYYQCWRNMDDPEDEGWSRDIRFISLAHLLR